MISFSLQYKEFLGTSNGGRILDAHLLGVPSIGENQEISDMDIVSWNLEFFSHFWWPKSWLVVGLDGYGNYYVAKIESDAGSCECTIPFVDHEQIGLENAASIYAPNYFGLLEKVVDEMV